MFKHLSNSLKKRFNDLNLDENIMEQTVLSLLEDYFKQNEVFLCFPKSFKNNILTIICSKSIIAQDLQNNKQKIINFIENECKDVVVKSICIKINY